MENEAKLQDRINKLERDISIYKREFQKYQKRIGVSASPEDSETNVSETKVSKPRPSRVSYGHHR